MPLSEKGIVISNKQAGKDLWEMEISAPGISSECRPGQFVHVRVADETDPLLRRPLSLYDVDKRRGSITLLYKIVGRGTLLLSRYVQNQDIDIMGPLGKGFSLTEGKKVILLGGGVGIAPLLFLARELKNSGNNITVFYGGSSSEEMMCSIERFNSLEIRVEAATMDGSLGYKGLVTDMLKNAVDPQMVDYIYTCGPEPMMAAGADYAIKHGIKGEVSLEEHMACGVGACLGCARKLKAQDDAYVKICKDGPVFPIDIVEMG